MSLREQQRALSAATQAARAAGKLMRQNLALTKRVNESTRHDIKLELDVRCQKLIERSLQKAFPTVAILGEEGILGDPVSAARWVVDPIDGTVNFTYGIPHACVSIALQVRDEKSKFPGDPLRGYMTLVGVVYDPFLDEMWTAVRGQKAKLNGKPIHV
ncbi:MAG: inositol monophosphatase family protein, partial [Limisphaerales bacterium]